ncbi:DUF6169 family protein [Flavobacterium restrictum]|uniref:Uncharacterized protein n=1 Tax=Flavobacterium restrictum TaxID=2594428 RepID=A0A553E1X6_9FLAO|nr:DUF6169 family protein [Flavobacterium restrictum]TRX38965.1 hypothetical protein FNW21_10255 [Flavobacterium restrictum]
MRYSFYFDGGKNNVYAFETDLKISYEVKFRPSSYLLGDETTDYASHIYEFIIEVVYNPLGKNPPLDKLISKTVSEIIKDFYYKKNGSVCIYICDSSDGRQELRRRKFDDWFYSETRYGLMKFDEHIRDSKGNSYPISLIIQMKNPYFIQIIDGFRKIALESNEDK